jgi:molybdopterin-synthase adenylyltransferase
MSGDRDNLGRYERQMVFSPLGLAGQRMLAQKKVVVVGVGALGSWSSQLLVRMGVGFVRLVDDDRVAMNNLHRQCLYTEDDASQAAPKVDAAARKLAKFNSEVRVEPIAQRLSVDNIMELASGMDVIIDGTDNFAARFLINDYSVKYNVPWVFAGVVGAEAQVMTIVPGRTPCLRCISETPPPPCVDPSCRIAGVLGPAAAAIASVQTMEAAKILTGHIEAVSPYLVKMDFWKNEFQRIDVTAACKNVDCPCCKQRHFEYLEA